MTWYSAPEAYVFAEATPHKSILTFRSMSYIYQLLDSIYRKSEDVPNIPL